MIKNKSRKASVDSSKNAVKAGKTATQLRNKRKRRAKKNKVLSSSYPTKFDNLDDPSQQYLDPYLAPTVQKARAFFAPKLSTPLTVVLGPTKGWRTVAKLAARMVKGVCTLGLFVPHTHRLVPIPHCIAHHSSINNTATIVQNSCRTLSILAWDEITGQGNLRYVTMQVEHSSGAVQVTLVWNGKGSTGSDSGKNQQKTLLQQQQSLLDMLCQALVQAHDEQRMVLHSLWINYHSSNKHVNAIFSYDANDWHHQWGKKYMTEVLNVDITWRVPLLFPPNVFRQANLNGFTKIIQSIRERLQLQLQQSTEDNGGGVHIVELYGGVGTIGLHLIDLVSTLVSSDENPQNQKCFQRSLKQVRDNGHPVDHVQYRSQNATQMVQSGALNRADWIIVDPPRKGLDVNVRKALTTICTDSNRPKHLVYVSCGFEAFCRDYAELVADGDGAGCGWKLEHAEGHILFPGSNAIETLAFFSR